MYAYFEFKLPSEIISTRIDKFMSKLSSVGPGLYSRNLLGM